MNIRNDSSCLFKVIDINIIQPSDVTQIFIERRSISLLSDLSVQASRISGIFFKAFKVLLGSSFVLF